VPWGAPRVHGALSLFLELWFLPRPAQVWKMHCERRAGGEALTKRSDPAGATCTRGRPSPSHMSIAKELKSLLYSMQGYSYIQRLQIGNRASLECNTDSGKNLRHYAIPKLQLGRASAPLRTYCRWTLKWQRARSTSTSINGRRHHLLRTSKTSTAATTSKQKAGFAFRPSYCVKDHKGGEIVGLTRVNTMVTNKGQSRPLPVL
jgi:hypothetical protein